VNDAKIFAFRDQQPEACELRVLTVRDPWATMIAAGRKQWETRTRKTHFRGWVAIHAGVAMTRPQIDLAKHLGLDPRELATGRVVAIAELVATTRTVDIDLANFGKGITDEERLLGDYTPGRWAWNLRSVQAFRGPKLKGKLGLWKPTETQRAQIFACYRRTFSQH
jgi:hypothetical protein